MPIFNVHHVTTYHYRQPVGFGEHRLMLRPRDGHDQRLLDFEVTITPRPESLRWSRDALGNSVGRARFSSRASELRFESFARVEHFPSGAGCFGVAENGRTLPVAFAPDELPDLAAYMERRPADPAVEAWARSFLRSDRASLTVEWLTAITQGIREGFAYVRRTERGIQDPALTLQNKSGTCRDFAVLMIDAARALGLPARFCSGYLYVPARDRQDIRGGGATHAWAQVYLPGAGWVDFDPTNAIIGNVGLIRAAVTRRPEAAIPLSGSFIGFRSDDLGMNVTVKVTREEAQDETIRTERTASLRA